MSSWHRFPRSHVFLNLRNACHPIPFSSTRIAFKRGVNRSGVHRASSLMTMFWLRDLRTCKKQLTTASKSPRVERMKTWKVYWSPEGKCIATVQARTELSAIRKAPKPYRKFLDELECAGWVVLKLLVSSFLLLIAVFSGGRLYLCPWLGEKSAPSRVHGSSRRRLATQ
jgi:hypothetical protein